MRRRYRFVVVGYVVMPEHVHLLLSEPERGDPSRVMQAIKQGFTRRFGRHATFNTPRFWQARFYDFVVFSEHKRIEKLRYMHRNPVKRGLVAAPEQWAWSSFRHYAYGENGMVLVNEPSNAELKIRKPA